MTELPLTFYEFFAGGGMARLGLGEAWTCAFANDFDPVKAATYRANFPDAERHLHEGDVGALEAGDLPGRVDLAWASSPCQDLSLAGARAGLEGGRSGAFFGFWRLISSLAREDRAPRTVVIENVCGLATSNDGRDFIALCQALSAQGYRFGALEIDAAAFVPQSRPRLFVVAHAGEPPRALVGTSPFHTRGVKAAQGRLPAGLAKHWVWWRLAAPPARNTNLAALLEPDDAVVWHSERVTERWLDLMGPLHRQRLAAQAGRAVGAAFRRTRVEHGQRVQRAEARFDGLAGCLRTPRGGSSRQALVVVENDQVRTRLVTPREAARLMGLSDRYRLPAGTTDGLAVTGDGVVAPVVRWLARELLEPLAGRSAKAEAA